MPILVVDDESDILDMLAKHIELSGMACHKAHSAVEALDAHARNLYPVVLTDIMMPQMDGIELIKRIRAIHPTCIVYVMTGHSTLDRMVECIGAGASDYFTKPFGSVDDVVATLRQALARHARWTRVITQKRKD